MLQLTGISGPLKGRSWPIGDSILVIGRGEDCDIIIREPYVSRRHCEIVSASGAPFMRDLGSSNTTMVNGVAVERSALEAGDEISVGSAIFIVAYASAPEERADGLPAPDHDTLSIAVDESSYLRNLESMDVREGRPRTVVDLSNLFHYTRNLSKAESVCDVMTMLGRELSIQLRSREYWIAQTSRADGREELTAWYPAESGQAPLATAPLKAMGRVLESKRGDILSPSQRDTGGRRQILLAPIVLGDRVLGVIGARIPQEGKPETVADLELLMALAGATAPYVISAEQIERLRRENSRLKAEVGSPAGYLGESRAAYRIRDLVRAAAANDLPVLVRGETGTGKEVVARMVHDLSSRRDEPFVVINCAAIPVNLFESELFGHERGAFSGATGTRIGRLEQANGGTLFLDEVGDLYPESQAKLLRAIELGEFQRVGGNETRRADIRVVSATNRDLETGVSAGNFRQDLYHRLNTFEIILPPLRDRRADIPVLARHFLEAARDRTGRDVEGIAEEAIEYLKGLRWPGNVRQLRQCIERAVAVAQKPILGPRDIDAHASADHGDAHEPVLSMAEVERRHIEAVLRHCEGRVAEAARLLGMGRTTVYNKINEYNIQV